MDDELTLEEIEQLLALSLRREDDDIDAYIQGLVFYLERKVLALIRDLPPLESPDALTNRQALRLLGGLESQIFDEGFDERVARIQELFDMQRLLAKETFIRATGIKRPGALPKEVDRAAILFIASRQAAVEDAVRRYLGNVREGIVDQVMSQIPVTTADVIENAGGRIFDNLKVDLQTSIAAFNRLVQLEQSKKDGLQFVLYAGPKDERNRPFCAERAQKVYRISEVYTWDNGQGLPADIYCGGYGCRHALIPVTNTQAQQINNR